MARSDIYYNDIYWNDFEIVDEHLKCLISGSKDLDLEDFFKIKFKRFFKKALVLNCGNGHVERNFITKGIIDSAIGIDISSDLLEKAKIEAFNQGMNIEYINHDINTFNFDSIEYDLLIVFAAGHHISHLNKVFYSAAKGLIRNNGMIIGFDYIGPHRNQYQYEIWEKINFYNKKLPKEIQNSLIYPHLPTMLVDDPSEAIHSENLEEILNRYFKLNLSKLGGGIAYEILSHNKLAASMSRDKNKVDFLNRNIKKVLKWDLEESLRDNRFNFFASFYGHPKNDLNESDVDNLIKEEKIYESKFPYGSEYYEKTFIQNLTEELSDKNIQLVHKQNYIDECHRKIDKLNSLKNEPDIYKKVNLIKYNIKSINLKSIIKKITKKIGLFGVIKKIMKLLKY